MENIHLWQKENYIYADYVQNFTLPGVFPNTLRALYDIT